MRASLDRQGPFGFTYGHALRAAYGTGNREAGRWGQHQTLDRLRRLVFRVIEGTRTSRWYRVMPLALVYILSRPHLYDLSVHRLPDRRFGHNTQVVGDETIVFASP